MDQNRIAEAYNRAAAARGLAADENQQPNRTANAMEMQRDGLEGTALDRTENLQSAFERAQEARGVSLEQERQQEISTSVRTTSAAQEISPDGLDGTALGRTESLKSAFERARGGRVGQENEKAGDAEGAEQRFNMNPPEHMREGVDRKGPEIQPTPDSQRDEAEIRELLDAARKAGQRQRENEKMKDGPDFA